LVGDRLGDVLQQHRLAGARRRDDQARWPLPCGETMSITRADLSLIVGSSISRVSFSSG
jgi:hypothetical protein